VGYSGMILRYGNSLWTAVSSPTTNNLRAVALPSPEEGWAVGDNGVILRYTRETLPLGAETRILKMEPTAAPATVTPTGEATRAPDATATRQSSTDPTSSSNPVPTATPAPGSGGLCSAPLLVAGVGLGFVLRRRRCC